MEFIKNIIKQILSKESRNPVRNPVGRWRIEKCSNTLHNKIDLSNEDHCGPCGQYSFQKLNKKEESVISVKKKGTE